MHKTQTTNQPTVCKEMTDVKLSHYCYIAIFENI